MNASFAQGDRCDRIQPFCAGDTQFIFPNSNKFNSEVSNAEKGPYYSCLQSQPYPAWFYLKISKPGDLNFEISQTVNPDGSGLTLDVDYVAWGPFKEGDDICSDQSLSKNNVAGCSYLPAPIENFNITNAETGDIFVVLITNYSEKTGYISLNQINTASPNAGSTDCSIVNLLGDDQNICGTDPVVLEVDNVVANRFKWFKKNPSTGSYIEISDETTSKYTVTSSGDYKVIAINDITKTEVYDEVSVQFFDIPVAIQPEDLLGCSLEETAVFDLNALTSELSSNYTGSPDSFTANFYQSQSDLDAEESILEASNYRGADGQTIFATITNNTSGCVSEAVSFKLNVEKAPEVAWNETTIVCTDSNGNLISPFILGQDLGDEYLYDWTPNNDPDGDGVENPIFEVNELNGVKEYALSIENKITGCVISFVTPVLAYAPPSSIQINISGSDFDGGYQVEAIVEKGLGDDPVLEYRLDNGEWQERNLFDNVSAGKHSVAAQVVGGCGSIRSENFILVGYPRFFTPNSDGYNDTWNVINNGDLTFKKVFIYDRFGKLLKQLDPNGNGWDGTFNGKSLPSDDYWFTVEMKQTANANSQFNGHFTLKR